jgi:UMF1 family MFS transporter
MNIVSLYFSLWVVNVMGGSDAAYGAANSISMGLMFLTAPLLGAISDQTARRIPFLVVSTLLCVLFTALLGIGGLAVSLACFVIANYMFQAGLIFYDALLPVVSRDGNRGAVGGLGIGLGYLGSFIGVGSGLLLLDRIGYVGIFRLSAALFLIFALPCFLFVREPPQRGRRRIDRDALVRALRQVQGTFAHARQFPGLVRFLIGHFFYADPVNTVIIFMGVYVTNEVGFTSTQAQIVLLVSIMAAVAGGLGWGLVADRIGPKRSLNMVLILWMASMTLAIAIAVLKLPPPLFWLVSLSAGAALGGTWASDRPYMLRLSPPRYVGEFYGLYSMMGRFATVIGPLMWGIVVDVLGWGRPAAIFTLLVFIIIAFVILQKVDDQPRVWGPELS